MSKKKIIQDIAPIPLQWIGPITLSSKEYTGSVHVPLATYESPLWPSTERGARVTTKAGGIRATLIDDRMSRSVIVEAKDAQHAYEVVSNLYQRKKELADLVATTSRFISFIDMHHQIVGNLLYIRFEMSTGDAAGHNMVTKAADHILSWIVRTYKGLQYVSISGNFCTDKKASCVNGILGRGKSVIAEVEISSKLVQSYLKTTPEKIVELNIKKNLIGSILAGSIRTANAHFANMLLGLYLATGQDAANIIEGSQGIVHASVRDSKLYFSVSLPNIIVGTVGNGKDLGFVKANLERLGLTQTENPTINAKRLAIIACATVLCGELSLLASQTNPGELVEAHMQLERGQKKSARRLS